MESIERVKKAEDEAIKKVEQTKKEAEWIIQKAQQKSEKEAQKLLETAKNKFMENLEKEEIAVDKEIKKILNDGKKQAARIKKEVEENIPGAVDVILDEIVR